MFLRRFLRDSAVYSLGRVATYGLSFALIPLYGRFLDPAEAGQVDLLGLLMNLATLVVPLEIGQGLARYYPEASSPTEKSRLAGTAFWFSAAAGMAAFLIVLAAARPLAAMLFDAPDKVLLVRLAAFAALGLCFLNLGQGQLRYRLEPRRYVVVSLVAAATLVATALVLVAGLRWGAAGALGAQGLAYAVAAFLAIRFAAEDFRGRPDRPALRRLLLFSAPLVPSSLGVFLSQYLDRLALQGISSVAELGVLGMGYRVAALMQLVLFGVQSALTPLVYSHHRDPATPAALARLFRLFAAAALLLWLGLAAFAPELLRLCTAPAYHGAAAVLPLQLPAVLLFGMYVFAPGLVLAQRTWAIAAIHLGGAVLNGLLSFTLIPRWGIDGAAWSALGVSAAVFAAYMIASQRLYPAPHSWRRLGAAAAGAALLVVLGRRIEYGFWLDCLLKSLLVALGAFGLVGLGLVRVAELRQAFDVCRNALRRERRDGLGP